MKRRDLLLQTPTSAPTQLACERRSVYELLIISAGMMGAYTYTLRGGVFCNAQTANLVIMAVAFGSGNYRHALYFLIPFAAYVLGAFLSELLPKPVRKIGFLRWDTYLIGFETLVLFLIGFVPLTVPHQVVQVIINFLASMQYNTFRQAEGIPMATTFCTNHVRQVGIGLAEYLLKHDPGKLRRGFIHLMMLLGFTIGGFVMTLFCHWFGAKAIWLAALPMLINFIYLVYADTVPEHNLLDRKPRGH